MSKIEGEVENLLNNTEIEKRTKKNGLESHTGDGEDEINEGSACDPGRYISGPKLSKEGTLSLDILQFDFCYGYDCLKHFNLTVLDENTVVFSSGNFINFFDVSKKKITFRRSALGGGIGHIRKNSNREFPYFAVAECGQFPIIIMYAWPSLEIICVLEGGAEKTYANIDFNPEGELLVSQSGKPDFLITVWDWQKRTILLRTKSYINDVYNVKFSPYVAGQLTTCGMAHIKFWKIASTFTGLKLKGELGRFGKTEHSDIVGALPMPDTKVVSGCSWGNILVWDNGLITFEVFRSLRRKCHDAPIVQFYYVDGELWTVSMDGHVKVWWFDKIDQADPPDDDRVILVDPTYDFYTPGVKLMALEKRKPGEGADSFWYAQDGNGGIWLIDLNTNEDPQKSERLYTCHGGKVTGLSACPYGPYIATLGELGSFFLHNYVTKTLAFQYTFPAPGRCLTWIKQNIDLTGEIILAGFGDGQVRVCCLHIPDEKCLSGSIKLAVSQVIKPHNKPITTMSLNSEGTILVTAGEDSTIFIFKLNIYCHHKLLVPIGFFPTTDVVTCIAWHPSIENEILVGCLHGHIMQIKLPSEEQPYKRVSFRMELQPQCYTFRSYKSQIKRDFKVKEIEKRKAEKLAKKRKEMEQVVKDNHGFAIDEETFLADSESEEELEPLFYPEEANRILWLKYTCNNTIWLSMAGYDAGYIYEYHIDQKDTVPVKFRLLEGADDMEVSTYVYTHNEQYLIFAMQDGSIRVNKTNPKDYADLSDYFSVTMHDNQNGFVPKLCFSNDEKYLFSCGYDGNIFSYLFNPRYYDYPDTCPRYYRADHVCSAVEDVETDQKLSLEEVKMKAEDDQIQKLADEHKSKVRNILKTLKDRYKKLLLRNSELLPSQIISREQLEPYDIVARYVDQIFHDKVNIIRRKLAFDVEKSKIQVTKLQNYFTDPCDGHPIVVQGINDLNCAIMTVRQRKMSPNFYKMLTIIEQKLEEEKSKGRLPERAEAQQKAFISKIDKTESPLEYFVMGLTPEDLSGRLGLTRFLKKYRKRRMKWDHRAKEWEEFLAKKPIPGENHPDDKTFLAKAKQSFGDYKLKESPDYKASPENRETTVKHYKRLLEARKKQYELRHNFIQMVFDIRDHKLRLIERLQEKQSKLDSLNEELPEEFRKNGPAIPAYNPAEFPEEKLQVKVVLPVEETEDLAESYDVNKPLFFERFTEDHLERTIIRPKTSTKFEDGFFQGAIPNAEVLRVADMTFEELLNYPDNLDTPFESCLKAKRLNKALLHQKLVISEMQDIIAEFNTRIYQARKERLSILVQGNFMDLFIICLNEELQILKSCDEQEHKFCSSINTELKRVQDMEVKGNLNSLKVAKISREVKLENLRIGERNIREKFRIAMENSEFYDFLKKVFKPPKVKNDEDSSSSPSSSYEKSDFQDPSGSTDPKDSELTNQDMNVCPKGCEQALFNFAVDLRTKRHDIEQAKREELISLDLTKKEIDRVTRQLETLKSSYNETLENLEAFRREKQSKLNHVTCTVVLNLDQIYGQIRKEDMDISKFLVFSRSTLTGLYKQVKSLHDDSLEEQGKHANYLTHLVRMRKDILYMQNKALHLKQAIQRLLKTKFGKEVDIDELEIGVSKRSFQKNVVNELEEVLLKKLVYELRMNMADVKGIYIAELECGQKEIASSQQEVVKEIKGNTRRLELLDVISKEKKTLAKFVDTQDKRRERVEDMEAVHRDFTRDLQKLQEIIEEQNRTLQDLREEIKLLKSKGMAPEVHNRGQIRELDYEEVKECQENKKIFLDYGEYITESDDCHENEEEAYEIWPGLINEEIKKDAAIEYYSSEGEDLVRELVEDILKNLHEELRKKSTDQIVHSILSTIMKCRSIHEMINEITDKLPLEELSEEQRINVETTAERLMSIQESQLSEENIKACVRDILEETLREVLCHDPHYLIPKILERLIDNLPLDLISSASALDEIALTIKKSVQGVELDEKELSISIGRLPIEDRKEILDILKEILERVYGH